MNALDLTRRHFLGQMSTGLAGVALSRLLADESVAAHRPHFAPKAKQVLQIFCPGAASHLDLWDHKPMLEKFHGTPLPGGDQELTFQGKNGNLMKSPWAFAPAGQSGKMISTMLPAHGRTRGRHRLHPLDDLAHEHARPGLHLHELVLHPRGLSQRRRSGSATRSAR